MTPETQEDPDTQSAKRETPEVSETPARHRERCHRPQTPQLDTAGPQGAVLCFPYEINISSPEVQKTPEMPAREGDPRGPGGSGRAQRETLEVPEIPAQPKEKPQRSLSPSPPRRESPESHRPESGTERAPTDFRDHSPAQREIPEVLGTSDPPRRETAEAQENAACLKSHPRGPRGPRHPRPAHRETPEARENTIWHRESPTDFRDHSVAHRENSEVPEVTGQHTERPHVPQRLQPAMPDLKGLSCVFPMKQTSILQKFQRPQRSQPERENPETLEALDRPRERPQRSRRPRPHPAESYPAF